MIIKSDFLIEYPGTGVKFLMIPVDINRSRGALCQELRPSSVFCQFHLLAVAMTLSHVISEVYLAWRELPVFEGMILWQPYHRQGFELRCLEFHGINTQAISGAKNYVGMDTREEHRDKLHLTSDKFEQSQHPFL
jgi:hypothetical protein